VFIATTPHPWGAVLPAGMLKSELFALLIATLLLLSNTTSRALRTAALPLSLLTGLAILGMVQLIPLSAGVLRAVSATSADVYAEANKILQIWEREPLTGRVSIAPFETSSVTLFTFALVALAASSTVLFASRRRRRTFLAVFLSAVSVQTIVAVSTFGSRTTGRIAGPFVNPNHFAAYLEVALACSLAVLWREVLHSRDRGRGSRDTGEAIERRVLPLALSALLTGVIGVGVGLTRSRGGVAAAVFSTMIIVALALSHRRLKGRARVALLGLLVIAAAIGFVIATAKREPVLRYLESDPREIAADTRVVLWRTSIDTWQAYPLLGSGLGTFREAYRTFQPESVPQLVEQAHSDPLQILVTGGVIGLLLGVGAIAACIVQLVRQFYLQEHREESAFVLAGIGSLLVLAIHGLVEFNFSIPAIPATLVCVVGMSFAAGAWKYGAE